MTLFQSINPFSGEVVNDVKLQSNHWAEERLMRQRLIQRDWAFLPVTKRVDLLRVALSYFERNREKIALDITEEMGKPLQQARNEVSSFFERAEYLLEHAEEFLKPEVLPVKGGLSRRIEHVPLGRVLVIAAWNYPLLVAINGVLTALLCGNTVFLKHALNTSAVGDHFEKAFGNISDCPGILMNAPISHAVVSEILKSGQVEHVVFTGSVKGGRQVYQLASESLISCHLELGGKDAAYIAADADIQKAAETVVEGALYNAGQSCCGIERVYVHELVYKDFRHSCLQLMQEYKLGDPKEFTTTLGPLYHPDAVKEIQWQVDSAVSEGATLLCGGQSKLLGRGVFFEPTLLEGVQQEMAIVQEENFGPVLPLMKVSGDDEALLKVNDCRYGLTAAIFTSSAERAEAFALGVNCGTIFRNRCDYLDPSLPWTGVGESGFGSSLSIHGFYGLTRCKSLHFRSF